MSRHLKLLLSTLLVTTLFAPGSLLAAAPTTPAKKEKKVKIYAKIAALDTVKNTITITDTNGKDTQYTVCQGTTIFLDGKFVKFTDLIVDLRVDISASGGKLSRIDAFTPPEEKADKAPKPAGPAPKEKKTKTPAKIAALDTVKNTITITDEDGKDTQYTVNRGTTISLDGKSVKFAELKAGLRVEINTSVGKLTRLEASTPPAEKSDKKK